MTGVQTCALPILYAGTGCFGENILEKRNLSSIMKTHQILRRCLCDNSNVWNIVSKRFKFKGSFAEYSILMKKEKKKEECSMGKGNAAVKQWLGNPRRFADLFNGIVFQGKQVILPEDLHPATGETDILVSDKNEKAKEDRKSVV